MARWVFTTPLVRLPFGSFVLVRSKSKKRKKNSKTSVSIGSFSRHRQNETQRRSIVAADRSNSTSWTRPRLNSAPSTGDRLAVLPRESSDAVFVIQPSSRLRLRCCSASSTGTHRRRPLVSDHFWPRSCSDETWHEISAPRGRAESRTVWVGVADSSDVLDGRSAILPSFWFSGLFRPILRACFWVWVQFLTCCWGGLDASDGPICRPIRAATRGGAWPTRAAAVWRRVTGVFWYFF